MDTGPCDGAGKLLDAKRHLTHHAKVLDQQGKNRVNRLLFGPLSGVPRSLMGQFALRFDAEIRQLPEN
jgi:hypothetical protein